MKITHKEPEDLETSDAPTDRLDLLKYLADVQSRINTDVTSDFTLASLSEQDKNGITEMFINAKLAKLIILRLKEDYSKNYKSWDKTTKKWTRHTITEQEEKMFTLYSERIYDTYMNRVYMVTILNRNKPKNILLQLLGGAPEGQEERDAQLEGKKDSILETFKKALSKKGKEKHEEED